MIWHESFSLFDGPPMKIRQLNSRIISETEQHDLCVSVPAVLTMRQLRYGHPCKKAEADEKEEGERAAETSNPVAALSLRRAASRWRTRARRPRRGAPIWRRRWTSRLKQMLATLATLSPVDQSSK